MQADKESVNFPRELQLAAGGTGLVFAPIVLFSEWTLKTTGDSTLSHQDAPVADLLR